MSNSDITTVGVTDEKGVKNYLVHDKIRDEYHTCLAVGNGKFSVGLHTGTLKSCKEIIRGNNVVYSWDKPLPAEKEDVPEGKGTFDCLNAAAALILWADRNIHVENILDCMGALDENGQPDVEWAKEELKRWESLQDGN